MTTSKLIRRFSQPVMGSLKPPSKVSKLWRFYPFVTVVFKITFLLAILPLFVISICPIYVIRQLVIFASKVLRHDLVAVLPIRDMFYAVDDIHGKPKSSVLVTMICKGRMEREMLMANITKALNKKRKFSKELLYPELKRFLVRWAGFIFWKEDVEFNPGNHVSYINREEFGGKSEKDLLKNIERQLVQEPYPELRAYWAMHILEDYKPDEKEMDENGNAVQAEHSAVFFKVHHSFVDGFSLLNLLLKDIMNCPTAELSMPSFPKRNLLQRALIFLITAVKAPYDVLTEALMEPDRNAWYLPRERVTNLIYSATSTRIPSAVIKETASNLEASFTGVVVNAISGGVRNYMVERRDLVGESFSCLVPFPVPGHPETLGNYLSDCHVEFPVEIADSEKRLRRIEEQLKEIKGSTVALSSFLMQPVFGGLFHWMISPLVEFAMSKSTGVFSSFPCPRVRVKGPCGEVVDTYFTAGHDSPGIGIQFLGVNYAGGWKLKIQTDGGTLKSDAEVERLLSLIVKELAEFHERSKTAKDVKRNGETV